MLRALKTALTLTGLDEVAAKAGCPQAELHVIVVDTPTIETLNRQFLKHDGPTDVIAFNLYDPDAPGSDNEVFGEIYICLDVACRAAAQCETSISYETVLYAVHGMLHLAGFDDGSAPERSAMKTRENEIMAALQEKVGIEGIFSAT
jgi:probable rRNA maturation factor